MVMIGFAEQRVSEQLVAGVLNARFLFDDVLGRVSFYVPSGAHLVRGLGAVHRQQRLVEAADRARVLMVLGERGHAPQRFAGTTAIRVIHYFHRVDGAVRVQRPPLVRYVRLVGERAGRAIQVETVVVMIAADNRLETVVMVMIVVVVIVVIVVIIVVVGERELVVVPLYKYYYNIIS